MQESVNYMERLRQISEDLIGRCFYYRNEPYSCKTAKPLSSTRLAITTVSRTLVLDIADLDDLRYDKESERILSSKDIERLKIRTFNLPEIDYNAGLNQSKWTKEEDELLMEKIKGNLKLKYHEIAERLYKTKESVSQRAYLLKQKIKSNE